jgi:hypothetical protein
LLNSPELQQKLQDPNGRAATLVASKKPPEEIIAELYMAGFGRLPQPAELSEAANSLRAAKDPKAGLTDLMWVMLNSKEFLFNH